MAFDPQVLPFGTAAGGIVVLRQWFAPPAWLSVFDMAGGIGVGTVLKLGGGLNFFLIKQNTY